LSRPLGAAIVSLGMASELKVLLDELEARIEKLKIAYEQYFMGIERFEPAKERQELTRIVRRLQTASTSNTAIKFRLNSLNQRFLSYQNYWNRVLREIEAGTYKRDVARLQRDLKRRGLEVDLTRARNRGELEAALVAQLARLGEEQDAGSDAGAQRPERTRGDTVASPPPIPAGAQERAPGTPPPLPAQARRAPDPEARLRRLYRAYVAAKKKVGEPVEGITYDRLVRTLQKQIPAIQQKTGCKHVDFKIEIKNGKAVLKAVPKS